MSSVSESEKSPRGGSGAMFDEIAPRYDQLNRMISFGLDQSWRRKAIACLHLQGKERILDLATGTADLAIQMAKLHPTVEVVGVDPSPRMLEIGQHKVQQAKLEHQVQLYSGEAEHLDFPDKSFDAVTMAFGIRNVVDRQAALQEIQRVTRPGGRVVILELSESHGSMLAPFARFHARFVVPLLGALVSKKRAYRYLEQSIAAFPSPEAFSTMMNKAGFEVLNTVRLMGGVAHVYSATAR